MAGAGPTPDLELILSLCVAEHCEKEDLEMDGSALDSLPDCVVLSQLFNFSKL